MARAEGVPLYAVETVRSLIDQDAVVARDGRYVFVDHDHAIVDLERLSAPTSLQTLIAARLDALTAAERRTVQDASVLGLTFRYASLLALTGTSSFELDAALAGLVGKGVLQTQDDPRSPELGQYRFLQAMVREVAYSTLARSDRRARHLAAAEQLAREEGEGDSALAGIIAQHLLDALAASSDHDPDRPALSSRARALLTTAATRVESLGAPQEALANTLAALRLDPDPVERCALQLRGARVAQHAGQPTLAVELATAAADGCEQLHDPLGVIAALTQQATAAWQLGRVREAEQLAQRAERVAVDRDDVQPGLLSEALRVLSNTARARGDRVTQQAYAVRVLRLAERIQDPNLTVNGLNRLAILLLDLGSAAAHRALVERSIVMAREQHLLPALANSLVNLVSELYPQDLGEASLQALESVSASKQLGISQNIESALTNACYTWWLAGDWDRLLSETSEWLEGRETTSASGPLWLTRAQVQLARGETVVVPDPPHGEDPYDHHVWTLTVAMAQVSDGDPAAAAETAARVQPVRLR